MGILPAKKNHWRIKNYAMGDFVHLHNHSHYSLQDGAAKVEDLVEAAVRYEMDALALTDHGVMYGAPDFYKKAKKAGIKPIIGTEAYIVFEGSRFDKKKDEGNGKAKSKNYYHLVLLAKNSVGYKNLMKLSTIGHTEGFYYKPRIDLEVLRKYSEGLICTSACLAGPVATPVLKGDIELAKKNAIILKEIFDEDFYLEIQNHGMDDDFKILEVFPKLSKELNIPLVATNDIHYIEKEHAIAHNILLLLSDKSGKADYRKLRYRTDQVYFKSADEMKELFKDFDGAIENTLAIAEKINFEMEFKHFHYPVFPIPPDSKAKSLDEYFEQLALEGLHKKFPKLTKEIEERFKYEIEVIKSMGYSGYFLIVQDFINAARQRGIPVGPGRGSAAGSLVAYTLGITNVNPLKYDLLFERFLNPNRKSMPDIDVDFADDQRGAIIDYVKEKYGEKSVSQIITFNRLSSKQVLRDVARVLNIPIPTVNNITKWIPSEFGKVLTIDRAINEVPELKWIRETDDPQIQELIKYAKILEGMNRNASKHAAGVVITPGEVSDFVPLSKASNSDDFITQYNMKELDDAGILKMDFLGLRTLSIIRDTIELVKKTRGIEIDLESIPEDDPETFKIFAQGKTTAVFQFESPPMREYLRKLKPVSIKDLAAMNALYRPGPMSFIDSFINRKYGRESIKYPHPELEPILKETFGIIVYQEQVIQIANKLAGMSLAEADILRRAMGKKDDKAMKEQEDKFINGAVKRGIDKKIAVEIFEIIKKFAKYGFNKSHSVAYSIVAYQTAYLKAHYLPEFLAANLTNELNNAKKVTVLLDDCRRLHVEVLPPDVNNPSIYFNVVNGKIIFGMSAIKNVGVHAVEELERARKDLKRNFRNIFDLCANVDTRIVNKRVLEGLVMAGALDTLEGSRAQNFKAIEKALDYGNKYKNAQKKIAGSLFGDSLQDVDVHEPELPDVPDWEYNEKLSKEREVLGFYLTNHPLSKYSGEYDSFATVHLGEQETFGGKKVVRGCGVITKIQTKIDKAGRQMAFFSLDDFTGSCECLAFSKTYAECKDVLYEESTVVVIGAVESSGDSFKIHVNEALSIEEARKRFTKSIVLKISPEDEKEETINELGKILDEYKGSTPVYLLFGTNGNRRKFLLSKKIKITSQSINELKYLLGEEAISYLTN